LELTTNWGTPLTISVLVVSEVVGKIDVWYWLTKFCSGNEDPSKPFAGTSSCTDDVELESNNDMISTFRLFCAITTFSTKSILWQVLVVTTVQLVYG
jgi:hypothetical protein